MPITPFFVSATEIDEIDFIIYLHSEERQPFIDELIIKAESLGLTVNPIYMEWGDWYYATHYSDWWDLSFGGILVALGIDDVSTLAYTIMGMDYYLLRHDDTKLHNLAWDLWNMRLLLENDPDVDIADLSADMIDKFHDSEERLWEKQYIFTFLQYLDGLAVRSEIAIPNCKAGHAFADENLRLTFSSIIDRTILKDFYHQMYPEITTYDLFHIHQWSSYHNVDLPNYMPT